MRWSPFPRTPSPGSWVGLRRSARSLEVEVRQQPGSGPALPHQGAGQPGRRQPLRTPPTSPPLLSLPTSYSAGPPVVQVRALRGRCGHSLSSSLPLQVPLFFPSAGSADPQHPWAPRPWRQSQQLFRPFNSSRGCRNSNCCIAHSGSALLMRL